MFVLTWLAMAARACSCAPTRSSAAGSTVTPTSMHMPPSAARTAREETRPSGQEGEGGGASTMRKGINQAYMCTCNITMLRHDEGLIELCAVPAAHVLQRQ